MAPARPPSWQRPADRRARCARRRRYEAYLDHYITAADLYFLDSAAVARQLVELGCGAPLPHLTPSQRPAARRTRLVECS